MPLRFGKASGSDTGRAHVPKGDNKPRRVGQRSHTGQRSRKTRKRSNSQKHPRPPRLPQDARPLVGLSIDASSSTADKLERIRAFHAQWKIEDLDTALEGLELVERQKQRCKDMGRVVFGFLLQEAQVDAIWTLMYEKKDLLLA